MSFSLYRQLTIYQVVYKLAIPARRTAELTALTADWMLLSNCVRSPVASGVRLCSASTYLVKVIQFVSIVLDISVGLQDLMKNNYDEKNTKTTKKWMVWHYFTRDYWKLYILETISK